MIAAQKHKRAKVQSPAQPLRAFPQCAVARQFLRRASCVVRITPFRSVGSVINISHGVPTPCVASPP
jgi:hypothetical protein